MTRKPPDDLTARRLKKARQELSDRIERQLDWIASTRLYGLALHQIRRAKKALGQKVEDVTIYTGPAEDSPAAKQAVVDHVAKLDQDDEK